MQDSRMGTVPAACHPTTSKDLLTVSAQELDINLYSDVRTVSASLDSGAPSLGLLVRQHGVITIKTLIEMHLVYITEMLNLRRPLTEDMNREIAEELLSMYSCLTMADIQVILRRVLRGEYGEMYESLNVPKVMKWFALYFDERCDLAEQRTLQRHEQYRSNRYYDNVLGDVKKERAEEIELKHAALEAKRRKIAAKIEEQTQLTQQYQ